MKWIKIFVIALGILIVLLLIFCLLYNSKSNELNREEKNINFSKLIGVYQIDKNRTDFAEYKNNIKLYETLTIKLNSDSTFKFNMSVPFIFDTIGKWHCSGSNIDEMNFLIFNSNNKIKTQFTQLYFDKGDSIFNLNSNTPRVGQSSINEIYFIKL